MVGEIGVGSWINDMAVTGAGDLYAATDSGVVALRIDPSSFTTP
ncbi:hypothetical protein [Nocardiopsis aegyptia]|uniref:Uncharacterized protein n=1 Tax=Nocardiopsis aegyptia TaxID=220378 RepID=A0A7Z0ERW3_9ACTN|nr:hypothetical protein [Nocardiopsis aegyptia]NYJ36606.1 hypothetical protein [Nocardiopsis aegyptia]